LFEPLVNDPADIADAAAEVVGETQVYRTRRRQAQHVTCLGTARHQLEADRRQVAAFIDDEVAVVGNVHLPPNHGPCQPPEGRVSQPLSASEFLPRPRAFLVANYRKLNWPSIQSEKKNGVSRRST
jgi:hypothetical protein